MRRRWPIFGNSSTSGVPPPTIPGRKASPTRSVTPIDFTLGKCLRRVLTPVTFLPRTKRPEEMTKPLRLHEDRLFPADPGTRAIARELYGLVRDLPIVSPHGHTDPSWFSGNAPFTNATELLLAPDHYLYRMLYSQGIALDRLGVPDRKGLVSADPREAWRLFASHFHLFRGTPSSLWLSQVFTDIFEIDVRLEAATADLYFDRIGEALKTLAFRPRALFERFKIEAIATTEGPTDTLEHHHSI